MSIAVVSWNTRDLLARCLESLHADAVAGLADVWVVDNASVDGSPDLVRERFPWVTLVASKVNVGFGAAVNAVAARTVTPWLAPANADVALAPGALATLLEAGLRQPTLGAVAPRLILPDGSTQHSVFPFPTVPFTLAYAFGVVDRSPWLARHWCIDRGFDPEVEREVSWAVGAFLLVRRSAWDRVGGFDESQWMYAEDLDLGWRLHRAGWATRYVPRAQVLHAESAATTQAWGGARHARWHASTYAWMARRRGFAVTRLVAIINVAGYLFRWLQASVAAASGSRAAHPLRERAFQAARAHAIGLRERGRLQRIR